jgi:uncharacterized protein
MKNIKTIIWKSLKELAFISPIFYIAIILAILIQMYVPEDLFNIILGRNIWLAIPVATLVGIILPIPRYATYPIAFALFMKGFGYGVVFALIGGEVIGESIARDIIEIKYLGWKFVTSRFFLSFIFITLGGFIIDIIL